MDPAQTTPDGKDLSWATSSLLEVVILGETISERQSISKRSTSILWTHICAVSKEKMCILACVVMDVGF